MNNLNSILVEGVLVEKPAFQGTRGKPSCTFSFASNRFYRAKSKIEKEVSIFEVEVSGKLAENCHNLGHEGRGLRIVGRLKQVKWTNAEGKPQSKVVIEAEHIEFRPVQPEAK
jgi:single-strand DNA-binding protein